jgi:hypothetical protein
MKVKAKRKAAPIPTDEPIGIVISPGADREKPAAAFAYVWAPAPEAAGESPESRVA